MTNRLGHKQTAVMFILMARAREVSNTELRDTVGFTLDGADRRDLNGRHLVDSTKQKPTNHFVHRLTDKGLAWCQAEMEHDEPAPPRPRSSLAIALYAMLGALEQYRRREGLRIEEIFTADVELTEAEIVERIHSAYRKLARAPRAWVSLTELRSMLVHARRPDVDAVLKELDRSGKAHLVPESNRKVLTEADHAAAIRIGGEDNHLISIEAS
ncbi:hypothetical protein SAMN05192558_10792 [Actinokineospora alba]|uniref:Uncharacterized protein n=1 Tax=Actinokineospora alba TaxID=504798 RepID=A0A1H0QRN0_9PSEU|nr:hypothetical protein [Actinokineospora alba]TDP70449.1 hypothetical protein C8E96_6059 [Actinokineospora alba]SDI31375.1 hypothetical protein SAMN05421871_10491 [Actinokineospora alba]SDP19348.1 hypothetical protein SAMN05192558_10792 [Actinokineospora alba]